MQTISTNYVDKLHNILILLSIPSTIDVGWIIQIIASLKHSFIYEPVAETLNCSV